MNVSKIVSITFGILFKKSFHIMDTWGSLVDQIIYKNNYFSPEYFSNVSSQYTLQGELSNPDKGHYLRISYENLVYHHVIESNFDEEFKLFKERVIKFLMEDIIYGNHLDVRRLGIVFTYELKPAEAEAFTAKYFRPEIKGISDFRFSKKESTMAGSLFSTNSDFINKIYTVGAIGRNKVGITYDYQVHYNPPREYAGDKNAEKFFENGLADFKKDIGAEV